MPKISGGLKLKIAAGQPTDVQGLKKIGKTV